MTIRDVSDPKITRSAGMPVTVGGIPYIVGGGYQGATEELEATVKRAAESLARTFKRNVEVRFNSDRRSGGAWIINSLPGFSGNCQVGIAAGIAGPGHYALTILTGLTEGGVYVATYVSESALKNESLVTDGKGIGEPYSWVYHRTVEEAVNWLIANIDTASIKD